MPDYLGDFGMFPQVLPFDPNAGGGFPGAFGMFPDAVRPMDPYFMEAPVGTDGSWEPLPVIRFPEADTYEGTATKAVMTFSVPLPDQFGVLERWLGDRFRNGLLEESRKQGVTPLVVGVWRDTGPIFKTNYTLTMIAAGASPVALPVILGIVRIALIILGIVGFTIGAKSVENILVGRGGTPAQFIPEGAPAPPGTVDRNGNPVPPGSPAPPGSYIPPKPGQPGVLGTLTGLAPLALLFLLVSMFKKG
jgi:hypothetical protein